jgi:hypothetical protein
MGSWRCSGRACSVARSRVAGAPGCARAAALLAATGFVVCAVGTERSEGGRRENRRGRGKHKGGGVLGREKLGRALARVLVVGPLVGLRVREVF